MRSPTVVANGWCVAVLSLMGCATASDQQSKTIEPKTIEPKTIEPSSAAGPTAETPGQDSGFTLSRDNAGVKRSAPAPLYIGDRWWHFRAEFLNVSDEAVKERDAAISDRQAPNNFWDRQTATSTASIWGSLCNECHGGRRSLKDALAMPQPPSDWGRGDGLFFGNRRQYAAVFNTVSNGGPIRDGKRSRMPAWTGKLPKEQIWALLYFLEFQSGGIEGNFPPSLYPRPLQQ